MIKIDDIYQLITKNPVVVNEDETIREILKKVSTANPAFSCIYVVDANNRLTGSISLTEILSVIAVRKGLPPDKDYSVPTLFKFTGKHLIAKDIMKEPITMKLEERLEDAIHNLIKSEYNGVAIINDNRELIGDLNIYEVLCNLSDID